MVKFAAFLAAIATFVTFVAAGGDVKLCSDINMQGNCDTLKFLNNVCYNLGSDLADKLSSVDPIGSNIQCKLFKDDDCKGTTMGFTKHHNTLGNFNDVVRSISCTTT
ncbi:hypothetical protein B0H34DRAFT_517195 [Crassisporium funariophilum]|nr:hypothetical protein B0H34DRAFT_517195 [Crassisporium funariophilum]